jgi:hypothetical protein
MFRNSSKEVSAIEKELGSATITPEVRSRQTVETISAVVRTILTEHANRSTTPDVHQSFSPRPSLTRTAFIEKVMSEVPGVVIPVGDLTIVSDRKRFVPNATVTVCAMAGRFQIALAISTKLARLEPDRTENIEFDVYTNRIISSIYADDWDSPAISQFVLTGLTATYKAWTAEINRRKQMIESEEAEIEKYRSRKS